MADSIVGGLFGMTPESYQDTRQLLEQRQALQQAQLDPYEAVNYMAARAGQQLGRGIGGLLGGQDPQLQIISARNAVMKEINPNDTENIKIALDDGWVITFPQGTTRSFKPVRKGTAHIILQHKPIVVPIVIDGFRRSFDRKGLLIKKKGILQSMVIKEPLKIDYENATVDEVVEMIEFAIEQHPSLLKVIPAEELDEKEKLDKERIWRY